ncbi:Crp/Fnr family transcriptional regulator [Croceimicrobium hydrocarbonivorans]|uniref:Crp/Fnr family transcriptional regulator n=1 Tax=Croceimicrobium hydrocarbonivorans TaxID=2761580 RepID=A0A7H0VHG0_9FLAO|nr:cyclic nucleotide-binding domain-containing protein [Croceimicrobium hydrocarbonivorans]QNR25158.1 Crp/Fnr family transcriptional regulator [Croceimicrobium hydrocarbonivorans]
MKDFFNKIHHIDQAILETYLSEWTAYQAPKKTILTAPGETERYIYFVQEGVQQSYYLNEDKKHVIAFTYPPSLSGIPESFLTQSPSKYYLETVTESSFLRLSYAKHQELMQEHREIETLFRKATELLLIGMVQRHYELMAFDINQRFSSFAQRSPQLFNLVAHKDLASYLRIDSSNFSKLFNSVKI